MSKLKDFFKPSWKKIYWMFLAYLVAEVYTGIIIHLVPLSALANIVSFVLNPASMVVSQSNGIEMMLAVPISKTIDLVWLYIIGTILAKEVSKDKD
jgi:hypothetical protein